MSKEIKACVVVFIHKKNDRANFRYKVFFNERAADLAIETIVKEPANDCEVIKEVVPIASFKDVKRAIEVSKRICRGEFEKVRH